MLCSLKSIQTLSQKLYKIYEDGGLTQEEYLELLKPLDTKIQRLESKFFNTHPQDTSVFGKSSSKQIR